MHLYNGHILTLEKGDILGHKFMGEVIETSSRVKNLEESALRKQNMAEAEHKQKESKQASGQQGDSKTQESSGDPGRTPGSAEGDEQTVDEDLARKQS